ncbi:MAG: hypothetical protein NTW36_15665, partial [Planctomycetia bacterium]|nr:hypothetical protein [Planctomycetia bacterium]
MKLGLLGIDEQIAWVLAAAERRGDEVVVACDVAADSPHATLVAGVPRAASWESLMDARGCDAVLVGGAGWDEARAEGVRKLVQAGRTLVLSQPLELSMLWAYELDMIRKDSAARLIPILPDRLHPFVGRLRRAIEAGLAGGGTLGTIETLEFRRRMRDRSRGPVLAQLARDADLVRVLVGDPRRLSTLGGADPDSVWNTLSVGLSGAAHMPVRWQVARGDTPGLSITLIGSSGSLVVEVPDESGVAWTATLQPDNTSERVDFDRGAAILDILHGGSTRLPVNEDGIAPAAWDDAARAIELADTVPRSVAKGRAIDLHQEEF